MAENLNLKTVDTVDTRPFKRLVMTIGELPTSFIESMTYYELLAWFVNYLETVLIPAVNNNAEATKELQDLFIELKDFVDNYFDNLDVQEEINNKLDEMVEDGTLEDIIANGAFKDLNVNDNFTIITRKITDTTRNLVYHKTILRPKNAEYIPLKGLMSKDTIEESAIQDNAINMFEFSTKTPAIFMSNADSFGSLNGNSAIIRNGDVLAEGGVSTGGSILAINNEGELDLIKNPVTASELISQGYVNSWTSSELIIDGVKNIDTTVPNYNEQHPRTFILQEYNSKDIIFLHIEGRRPDTDGVTFDEGADLILETIPNVRVAGSMGGGGDTQLMIEGRMLNDCNDAQLRPLPDIFYLDPNLKSFADPVSSEIGNARLSELTLKDFLKTRVNLTETYKYAKAVMTARYISSYQTSETKFVCDVDYNVTLNEGDTIIVKFPDVLTDSELNPGAVASLNIHYADKTSQKLIKDKYGNNVRTDYINDNTFVLQWSEGIYKIVSNPIMVTIAPADTDLDDITETSLTYSTSFDSVPSIFGTNVSGAGLAVTFGLLKGYAIQYYTPRTDRRTFIRNLEDGVWSSWTQILTTQPNSIQNQNLNNFVDQLYYGYGNNITNKPADTGNGWAFNIPGASTGYNLQFFVERETGSGSSNPTRGRMFFRLQEDGAWKDWKKVATETL